MMSPWTSPAPSSGRSATTAPSYGDYATAADARTALNRALREHLTARDLGGAWLDVAGPARRAATQGQDFGQLFLGLSGFLVIAAAVLTALMLGLNADHRARDAGVLLALGWTRRRVAGAFIAEGAALAWSARWISGSRRDGMRVPRDRTISCIASKMPSATEPLTPCSHVPLSSIACPPYPAILNGLG